MVVFRNIFYLALQALSVVRARGNAWDLRNSVDYNEILPMKTNVDINSYQSIYQPALHRVSGCDQHVAIDMYGHISTGLKPNGHWSRGCDDERGQTYSRMGIYPAVPSPSQKQYQYIAYAWYVPKIEKAFDLSPPAHKHGFVFVVGWLTMDDNPATVGLYTMHSGFVKHALPYMSHPFVSIGFQPNGHLQTDIDETRGIMSPIADWDYLMPEQKSALNFFPVQFPLNDNNIEKTLAAAYPH